MEVGLLFTFRNPPPWQRSFADLYRTTLEEIVLAESLGIDAVWLAEHHFTDDGWSPAVMPLAAAVAVRTTSVRIGTFVLLLPQHHPVRVAEDVAVVDILSGGRLTLGVGLGYRAEEYTAVGLSPATRGSRMDEALAVLVGCLERDQFSFEGRWYQATDVSLSPRPVQRPRPPIITAGTGERALERASRFCDGLAVHPPTDVYERHVQLLRQHGRDPSAQRYYAMVLGFVADTNDRAWDLVGPHAAWEHDHYTRWLAEAGQPPAFMSTPRDDFIIGDASLWTRRVEAMLSQYPDVPCHHLVVELVMAGMGPAQRRDAIERFAADVLPGLRQLRSTASS